MDLDIELGKAPTKDDKAKDDGEGGGEDFAGDATKMAVRGFAKALGLDAGSVDIDKATKALRAVIASCSDDWQDD